MEKLTSQEAKEALEALIRLFRFEAEQRRIRGYGAFKESEIPIPALIKLTTILKDKADET